MPQTATFLRRQLFVDTAVQSELLRRIAIYALCTLTYFLTIVVMEESLIYEDRGWQSILVGVLDQSVYWLPGLLMLAPIMMYDLLKVTNRFAGPMYSLRREMQRLVDGESQRPVFFRNGDYWNEMATSFNQLREELINLREQKDRGESNDARLPNYEGLEPMERLFDQDQEDDGEESADPLADLPTSESEPAEAVESV